MVKSLDGTESRILRDTTITKVHISQHVLGDKYTNTQNYIFLFLVDRHKIIINKSFLFSGGIKYARLIYSTSR